ncbi:MAG: sigma-70 family RNA polymerase sigma factor [Gaiellaceae bacterium]
MSTPARGSDLRERELLALARSGDGAAYGDLVEPHRSELHAHCYRMLGSVSDAEDALQEALLRGWRGLRRFEGRSSVRTWLYRIATNACIDLSARRTRRVLPVDHVQAARRGDPPGAPLVESVWIEPYPDAELAPADGAVAPEARFEQRESLELAFVAALQLLTARQRAALILREVLGFSAQEVAELLGTTVVSVNSALQRARRTIDGRLPEHSQQTTLRALGGAEARSLVQAYMDAMERADVDAIVGMLTEDAAWSMPPMTTWYRGHDVIATFLAEHPFRLRWRHLPAHANGQLAVGCYVWDAERGAHVAAVLDVLTLRGARIAEITAFVGPDVLRRFGLPDELPHEAG